jgi:hypothetical protein
MFATLVAGALANVLVVPISPTQPPQQSIGIYMTSVMLGDLDPNNVVPTANGVPGAGTSNWDVALPLAALQAGTDYKLTLTFEDVSYTGPCYVDVRMTQIQNGKKVLLRDMTGYSGQCSPNIYLASVDFGAVPDAPGPVSIAATAHYGKAKSQAKVQMIIQ